MYYIFHDLEHFSAFLDVMIENACLASGASGII